MRHLDPGLPPQRHAVVEMPHLDPELPSQRHAVVEMPHLDAELPPQRHAVVEMPHLDAELPSQRPRNAPGLAHNRREVVLDLGEMLQGLSMILKPACGYPPPN